MVRYCERCREIHEENDICPHYKQQLKEHPEWLSEAAIFASVAAQYQLITTQALDTVARAVNQVAGTHFSYEGTYQAARDVRVFAKLNSDAFRNSGQFANAETAQKTMENASDGFKRYLHARLNGTGQEIDWLSWQQGKLDNLLYKYQLPDGNTVGYDGIKINRFTGKTVERITIKAAEGKAGLHTNAVDVVDALEKNTLQVGDTVVGVDGIRDEIYKVLDQRIAAAQEQGNLDLAKKLLEAKNKLKIREMGDANTVSESTKRLTEKIENGKAATEITRKLLVEKVIQGAVVGAAVSLTISGITNYIKLKNGETTEDEAFRDVGEDTVKGLLTGGAMGGISLFLPAFPLGTVAGMTIGIYLNAVCTNVLDEVFGKGAYGEILDASGFIYGTTRNVGEMLHEYQKHLQRINTYTSHAKARQKGINRNLDRAEEYIFQLEKRLED